MLQYLEVKNKKTHNSNGSVLGLTTLACQLLYNIFCTKKVKGGAAAREYC